jgi:hypothetical protein
MLKAETTTGATTMPALFEGLSIDREPTALTLNFLEPAGALFYRAKAQNNATGVIVGSQALPAEQVADGGVGSIRLEPLVPGTYYSLRLVAGDNAAELNSLW